MGGECFSRLENNFVLAMQKEERGCKRSTTILLGPQKFSVGVYDAALSPKRISSTKKSTQLHSSQ